MNNEEKMLQLVLSDDKMSSFYEYDPNEYHTLEDALRADNPVVVAVAKIIRGTKGEFDRSVHKEIYNEVFNYLIQNML